jgi:hypothetical protein
VIYHHAVYYSVLFGATNFAVRFLQINQRVSEILERVQSRSEDDFFWNEIAKRRFIFEKTQPNQ